MKGENRVKTYIGLFFFVVFIVPILIVIDWIDRLKEAKLKKEKNA